MDNPWEPPGTFARPSCVKITTVVLLLGLGGCSSAEPVGQTLTADTAQVSSTSQLSGDSELFGVAPCIGLGGGDASEFVGLADHEAASLANEKGYLFNVRSRDGGPCNPMLANIDPDRVNVELVAGTVVRAARF